MKIEVTNVQPLTDPHDESTATVRVANAALKSLGGRRSWVQIKNNDNKRTIYRMARGAGSRQLGVNSIELDYDSELELGFDKNNRSSCKLEISNSLFSESMGHWLHPDYTHRLPIQIAILSFLISLASLYIAIID